ncbi:MAG: glycosyltransferase family 4 protein [Anaerolineae bacterium]|nr:glycosyltransferase family 4 protein [Anaerolineae bacterium]
MRIVHVTHRAWPVVGGSEQYVQEVARRQVLDQHQVTVVATDAEDLSALWSGKGRRVSADAPRAHQGVRIERLPVHYLPWGAVTAPALRRATWLLSAMSGYAALPLARFSPWIPRLPQTLAETPADLLIAWNLTLEGLTAAVAREAARRQTPWVAMPLLHLGRGQFYTMRHQLELLRAARAVLAQTPLERAFLLERGIPAARVHLVSPGVDPEGGARADGQRFRHKHAIDGPLVVTMGALCYDKGTHHLLAAARRFWEAGRPLTVALVGPRQEGVQRALARLGPRERSMCRAMGLIPEAEKWDAVAAADVVALPSRTESFGIVFLEGWLCGKPVIGARSGAVPDVIDAGRDGLLVDFGDVGGLAAALAALIDDPNRAAEMGHHGREKVLERYTWDVQYARLRGVIDASLP